MELNDVLYKKCEEINKILAGYMPAGEDKQSMLVQAMNYAILAGGKRLRPILIREFYRLFAGEDTESVTYPYLAAMEMIHTYSLIHDDLPAMDNDMLRRGMPTVFAKFGEAMAILAGDGLLNLAAECVLTYMKDNPDIKNIRAAHTLFNASGYLGMAGGQSVDVWYEKSGHTMDGNVLDFIYATKTGALIYASMQIGAILGGADEAVVEQIGAMGDKIGKAFQIRDDILDITSTQEVLGKPIGSDEKNNKTTMVTLHGIDECEDIIDRLTDDAVEILMTLPGDKEFIKDLFLYLAKRDR